ncbi:MAG: hypothetical protein OXH70_17525 [Acidobacteria bacterium]|nr:hypothetical protein [Acidobacteriota bacterium]
MNVYGVTETLLGHPTPTAGSTRWATEIKAQCAREAAEIALHLFENQDPKNLGLSDGEGVDARLEVHNLDNVHDGFTRFGMIWVPLITPFERCAWQMRVLSRLRDRLDKLERDQIELGLVSRQLQARIQDIRDARTILRRLYKEAVKSLNAEEAT